MTASALDDGQRPAPWRVWSCGPALTVGGTQNTYFSTKDSRVVGWLWTCWHTYHHPKAQANWDHSCGHNNSISPGSFSGLNEAAEKAPQEMQPLRHKKAGPAIYK